MLSADLWRQRELCGQGGGGGITWRGQLAQHASEHRINMRLLVSQLDGMANGFLLWMPGAIPPQPSIGRVAPHASVGCTGSWARAPGCKWWLGCACTGSASAERQRWMSAVL